LEIAISLFFLYLLSQDYQLISPRLYHARHKREIASSRDDDDGGASSGAISK
jgi:hypothetical protein